MLGVPNTHSSVRLRQLSICCDHPPLQLDALLSGDTSVFSSQCLRGSLSASPVRRSWEGLVCCALPKKHAKTRVRDY